MAINGRYGSGVMVDMLKLCGIEYEPRTQGEA